MEKQARTPKRWFSSIPLSGRPNAHENRRAENLRRRQSPASLRRPLFSVPQAQDRLRDRGRGRGLRRELRAEGDCGDDRGCVRAPCRRRRSVPHRGALAQRLRPRLFRPARHFADGRPLRHRDGAVGHRRQGGHASPSMRSSAARCTSGCAATPTSIRTSPARTPIPTAPSIRTRTPRRHARSNIWRKASPR